MKQNWRFHSYSFIMLRKMLTSVFLGQSIFLLAAPVSTNRVVLEEIVATTSKQFGGRRWVFKDEADLWNVTNKEVAFSFPVDVVITPSDEFATLMIFDVSSPNDYRSVSTTATKTNEVPAYVDGYMETVEEYFFNRENVSRRMQPLLLFRYNGGIFSNAGSALDEFGFENLMYWAEWFDLQPDFYTSYPERIAAFVDPGPNARGGRWTPWCETNQWNTPQYALNCKSMDDIRKAALYPYTNALSRVKARLGGTTWMETDGHGQEKGRNPRRSIPLLGAEICCDIQSADPPTYVLFAVKIVPVGTFTNNQYWVKCRSSAERRVEDSINGYYARLWGRRDCYKPHVAIVFADKSEGEWNPSPCRTPSCALAPDASHLVASNIWDAQILKCTPDALFMKPRWYTDTFDFTHPTASQFSSPAVTDDTLVTYSNAIGIIRDRFLGTNMVACASLDAKTPVVVTDVGIGIVPPVLELRLDAMPCDGGKQGLDVLTALSKDFTAFVATLPRFGKDNKPFFPRFIVDGREVAVEPRNLSEKQLAGRLFLTGMYWSKGYFNIPNEGLKDQ